MTNQIFYWKQITSPADLPKEEGEYTVKLKSDDYGLWGMEFSKDPKQIEKWERVSHCLCPLTVDNIPEWVEEEAVKYALGNRHSRAYTDFKFGASLLLPLIQDEWTTVEDKMPEEKHYSERVLCYLNTGKIEMGWTMDGEWLRDNGDSFTEKGYAVTHWKKISPPKGTTNSKI